MGRCRIESLGVSLPQGQGWGSLKHALEAGRDCLRASRYRPEDVGVLINTGVHRDGHVCEPAGACFIQHQLGINVEFHQDPHTLSFDLLNGGCGMFNAIHVLGAQMKAGAIRVGMVVSSEANRDEHPDPGYPYVASGAALLLDRPPRGRAGFGAFAFQTNENHAGLYTSVVSLDGKHGRIVLKRMAEIEDAYLETAVPAVEEVLEKDGLRKDELDLVVPAQVSPRFLSRLPEAIGIPAGKVADFTADLPDTLSTSTFLALHRVQASRRLGPGRTALLLAFGSGVTAAAATYRF